MRTLLSIASQVSLFLRDICTGIFPRELWGSRHNEGHFLREIDRFVRLRRYEDMHVSEVI